MIDKRALVGFSMVAFFLFLRYGSICSAISVPAFGDDSLCVCVIANRTAAVEMPLVAWFGLGVNKVEAI